MYIILFTITYNPTFNPFSEKIYKLRVKTKEQRNYLFQLAESKVYEFVTLHKIHNQTEQILVEEHLIPVFESDMARWNISFIKGEKETPPLSYDVLHNSSTIYDSVRKMSNANDAVDSSPIRSEVFRFGATSQGKGIYAVRIGLKKNDESTIPIILGDAGIHGNEWIAPLAGHKIIDNLLFNSAALEILDKVDVIFSPCVNRDGYDASLQKQISMMYGRKNHQLSSKGGCAVPENVGTNINRNFDWFWDSSNSREDPCNYNYRGDYANSANETIALISLMNIPNVRFYYTIHAFGNLILYPYGHSTVDVPNRDLMHQVAAAGQKVLKERYGQSYVIGSTADVLYTTTGASKDYATGVANITISLIHEIGGDAIDFQPRDEDIAEYADSAWGAFEAMSLKVIEVLNL